MRGNTSGAAYYAVVLVLDALSSTAAWQGMLKSAFVFHANVYYCLAGLPTLAL